MITIQQFHCTFMNGKQNKLKKCLQDTSLVSEYEEYTRQTLIGSLLAHPSKFSNRKETFDIVANYRNITFVRGTKKSSIGIACEKTDLEMTKWLLEAGVDPNQCSDYDCPINQVIFNQQSKVEEKKEFLRLLFRYGASLNIIYRDRPLLKHLYRYDEEKEKEGLILLESCIPYFSEEDMKRWKAARLENVFVKKRKYLQRK